MPLSNTIQFTALEDLSLDPYNPRLGLSDDEPLATQERVLELMRGWNLEELAISFLENGFWPQEAVIVVKEKLYDQTETLVVVEGNRRIAALKYLRQAFDGNYPSRTWRTLTSDATRDVELFRSIPFICADSRADVTAYLGFRHVTGIKQWDPTQKAEFIASLIDEEQMSYDTVRKQIGMRVDTVRRNYIAFRIRKQIDSLEIDVSEQGVEKRFSVLFLSLREESVRNFLGIDLGVEPHEVVNPVSDKKIENLVDFALWLFGSRDQRPLFTDSRYVGSFARILASSESIDYLRSSPHPSFEVALQKAGVEDEEIEKQLKEASTQMELALSRVHLHLNSNRIQESIERLARTAKELLSKFPSITNRIGLRMDEANDA